MSNVQRSVLDELCRFSSATIFNAVVEAMGGTQGGIELSGKGGQPICYTDQTLQYMLPEFGTVAGYAVTMELTPMDPDACLLYTSPSPRDQRGSRMPSSA